MSVLSFMAKQLRDSGRRKRTTVRKPPRPRLALEALDDRILLSVAEFPIPTANSNPYGITRGPDGNLWFTEALAGRIGRITPAGVVTEFSQGLTPGGQPIQITAGPDGNLWFTEQTFNAQTGAMGRIGRITPAGVITEFSAGLLPFSHPMGITAGRDGNLWFTDQTATIGRIGRITPAGVITEFTAGLTDAQPNMITAGPDGNLWFGEESGKIGRITTAGAITEFTAGLTGSVFGITAGPDGNLWFTENSHSRIGRITPAGVITEVAHTTTAGAVPLEITAGPDGNLWFTEAGRDRIGRITTAGVLTEFSAGITRGGIGATPGGIAVGPDGNIWFTEIGGNRIGRLDLAQAAFTATFSAAQGMLTVTGDAQDNTIAVSRDAGGTILVNGNDVIVQGVTATVTNTHLILLNGGAGNDKLSLDETNGALPLARLDGGAGNDVLTGGSVGDVFYGAFGNDTLLGGAGNDTFAWSPGDGNDVVEGQGGRDLMMVAGTDVAEKFAISDSGIGSPIHRARLTRDVGNVTMDLNGIEDIEINAAGGADTITVNDLSATDIFDVNLDLGDRDGQPDAVILNGTDRDDFIQIAAFDNGTRIAVGGLFPFVNITGAEGTTDHLTVNALGGNDRVDASGLPANLIGLTVNLGDGQPPPAAPPTLAPIANQAVAAGQSLTLTLQGNDPAGLPLTYSARVDSLAYHLKSTLGLFTTGNFFTNWGGGGEQWVQGTGGAWYYILPSGAFYQWSGSGLTGTLVAQLDPSYNANPSLLVNAQPGQGQATVSVVGSTLKITPNAGFTGLLFVTATVSDGQQSASQAFQLTVS